MSELLGAGVKSVHRPCKLKGNYGIQGADGAASLGLSSRLLAVLDSDRVAVFENALFDNGHRSRPIGGHAIRWAMAAMHCTVGDAVTDIVNFSRSHVLASRDLDAGPTCAAPSLRSLSRTQAAFTFDDNEAVLSRNFAN